jgi:hypothetical protein
MKLSNALHLCRESDPCFVVLFQKPPGAALTVYAREFDSQLMALALKRARQADHDGDSNLHRIRLAIPFGPEDDHTNDLLGWIELRSSEEPAEYANRKAILNKTLGFETGRFRGTITMPIDAVERFIEHSVGIRERAEVDNVRLQDVRFDITAGTPIFDGRPDTINVRVHPDRAELRFSGANGRTARFGGEFRAMNLPGAPAEFFRAKFDSKHVQATMSGKGSFHIDFQFSSDERLPLREQLNHASFAVASLSPMSLALWVSGRGEFALVTTEQNLSNEWSEWFEQVYLALAKVTRSGDKPVLSDDDLGFQQAAAERFAMGLSPRSLRLDATLYSATFECPTIRYILYFQHLTAGDWTFSAIVRRPALSQTVEGDRISVDFGDPTVLDRGARRGSWEGQEKALRGRFQAHVRRSGSAVITLDNGDFMGLQGSGNITITR